MNKIRQTFRQLSKYFLDTRIIRFVSGLIFKFLYILQFIYL